jgi:hypothetical protein
MGKKSAKTIKGTSRKKDSIDEEAFLRLIRGLNFLINEASTHKLLTASRILYSAKESLVFWGTNFDFQDSKQDQFINTHLPPNCSSPLSHFIGEYIATSDAPSREDLISALESFRIEHLELLKSMNVSNY